MFAFYIWDFRKRKKYILLGCISLLLLVGLFFFLYSNSNLFFEEDKEVALTKGNVKNNKVALTFNVSWGDEKVNDILDILDKHKVKATFFLNGEWAERHPHIVQKIAEAEHDIGALGYRYETYIDMPLYEVKQEMSLALEVFKKLHIDTLPYFRAPNGHVNKDIFSIAEQLNVQMVHWSVQVDDWKNRDVKSMTQKLQKEVSEGDIVLLHASDAAIKTADVLDEIIPFLKKKKLTLTKISELIYEIDIEEKVVP